MSINLLSKNSNNAKQISFSGQRLMPLVIKTMDRFGETGARKINKETCYLTKLDESDIPDMKEIRPYFYSFDCARGFICDFLSLPQREKTFKRRFNEMHLILEAPKENDNLNRIRGMVELGKSRNTMLVNYLDSASEYNFQQKVMGAGTALMYGVCRLAEKLGYKSIRLWALDEAADWYKKLGLKEMPSGYFVLRSKDFANFQKKLEAKLQMERPEFLN